MHIFLAISVSKVTKNMTEIEGEANDSVNIASILVSSTSVVNSATFQYE